QRNLTVNADLSFSRTTKVQKHPIYKKTDWQPWFSSGRHWAGKFEWKGGLKSFPTWNRMLISPADRAEAKSVRGPRHKAKSFRTAKNCSNACAFMKRSSRMFQKFHGRQTGAVGV